MSRSTPDASELLRSVLYHLENVVQPALSGASAYHNRVAINVLNIVRREIMAGSLPLEEERERLLRLLGAAGTLEELNAELCRKIRARELCVGHPDLMRHLRHSTREALAVDNPGYPAYTRAT